jgi:hypothetical protein
MIRVVRSCLKNVSDIFSQVDAQVFKACDAMSSRECPFDIIREAQPVQHIQPCRRERRHLCHHQGDSILLLLEWVGCVHHRSYFIVVSFQYHLATTNVCCDYGKTRRVDWVTPLGSQSLALRNAHSHEKHSHLCRLNRLGGGVLLKWRAFCCSD